MKNVIIYIKVYKPIIAIYYIHMIIAPITNQCNLGSERIVSHTCLITYRAVDSKGYGSFPPILYTGE